MATATIDLRIELPKVFDMFSIAEVEKCWNELITGNPEMVIIDCGGVKNVDSPAIGLLVKFNNLSKKAGFKLELHNIDGHLLHFFKLTSLDRHFTLCYK